MEISTPLYITIHIMSLIKTQSSTVINTSDFLNYKILLTIFLREYTREKVDIGWS
jgi:hypothetical protein